jgi:hypothetical protein
MGIAWCGQCGMGCKHIQQQLLRYYLSLVSNPCPA